MQQPVSVSALTLARLDLALALLPLLARLQLLQRLMLIVLLLLLRPISPLLQAQCVLEMKTLAPTLALVLFHHRRQLVLQHRLGYPWYTSSLHDLSGTSPLET